MLHSPVCIIETFTEPIQLLFMGWTICWRAREMKFATKWVAGGWSAGGFIVSPNSKQTRPRAQNCMFRCGHIPKCWGRARIAARALRSDTFEAVWCNFIVPAGFIIASYLFASFWRPNEPLASILFHLARRLWLLWAARARADYYWIRGANQTPKIELRATGRFAFV